MLRSILKPGEAHFGIRDRAFFDGSSTSNSRKPNPSAMVLLAGEPLAFATPPSASARTLERAGRNSKGIQQQGRFEALKLLV
jgi:hypothetical protein